MLATVVYVHVKPEFLDAFIEATRINHAGSVREPGNVRFDVVQHQEDPAQFVLYEVFQDAHAAAAHKLTPHYLAWKELVADWMAEPRRGVAYRVLCPEQA